LVWKAVQGTGGPSTTSFQHPYLVDSIPSAITSVDSDGNGAVDRLLVADTGGNVWRADLKGSNRIDWKLTLLAVLGRHDGMAVGQADDRRFFHRPDIVFTRDEHGPFDAVILGSGDRANPLNKGGATDNYLFMIKDRNIAVGAGTNSGFTVAELGDITSNCLQDDSCVADPNLAHGWRMKLIGADEKMLSTPVTVAGTIYATSFLPTQQDATPDSCELAEGGGRLYAVALQDGTATRQDDPAYDPDYDPENPGTDGRSTELNSPGIPPEVVFIAPDKILRPDLVIEDGLSRTRWKTFWYTRENLDL
jgi:type IV pilus assembly protein PilY1